MKKRILLVVMIFVFGIGGCNSSNSGATNDNSEKNVQANKDKAESSDENKYELAKKMLEDNSNIDDAYEILVELGDYQESESLINQYYYLKGVQNYKNGVFEAAKSFFALDNDYQDTEMYISNIEKLISIQGEWLWKPDNPYTITTVGFVVNGWNITHYIYTGNNLKEDTMSYSLDDLVDNSITFKTDIAHYELTFNEDNLSAEMIDDSILDSTYESKIWICKREDFLHNIIKEEPQIGMTADEVRESTWGTPEEVNKDTYSWGTREQWCYPGYKYIYLEDGIVTSISE